MKKHVTYVLFLGLSLLFTSLNAHSAEASVKRAILTSQVEAREPVDKLNSSQVSRLNKIYFFTEVMNAANSTVTHRWFRNGKLEAEVVLKIGSNRWRTFSSKNLTASFHTGNWEVMVVDETGRTLASETFEFVE